MIRTSHVIITAALGVWIGWRVAGRGEKTSDLRTWDVFALGPWLVSLAHPSRTVADWERLILAFSGGATIGYNGRNMLVADESQRA